MLDLDAVVLEDLCEELAVGVGVDPHRPQPRLDLLHGQVRRQHPLQRPHVHLELGPLARGLAGVVELGADVPGQVLGRGHQALLGRVVVDELAELRARLGLGRCRGGGRSRRGRRGRGCPGRSPARPAGCRRRAAARAGQRLARRGSRPALRSGCVSSNVSSACTSAANGSERKSRTAVGVTRAIRSSPRVGVGAAGAPQREAVDRPVPALVVAVAVAAAASAELGDLAGVLECRGLGAEQLAGGVAQAEQRAQLRAVRGGDLQRLDEPAAGHAEGAVLERGDVPVPGSFGR